MKAAGNPLFGVLWPVVMAAMITGCASRELPIPDITTTDRERGLVELTHAFGPDEPREANWQRARAKALRLCRKWGHDGVRSRGEPERECRADNRYRKCTRYFLTKRWVCTDQ